MSVELWKAILDPGGPHYREWYEIFGESRIPLESSQSQMASLGDEKNIEVYKLDLRAMTLGQRAKLLSHIAGRFGVPVSEVEAEIAKVGFPIRAADVIVSYDMRAFV